MTTGHIKLDGKSYMLETAHYQRALANPFAAKIGTGAGDYNDLDDWAAWLMDDWQAGVGLRDTAGGGFLYGEADTRFPNQMTLPPLVTLTGLSAAGIRQPGSVTSQLLTDSTDSQRYACKFTAPVTETVTHVWVLVQAGIAFTVGIYSDSTGPNALVGSGGAVTSSETAPGYYWVRVTISAALTATTAYWLVVYPTTGTDVLTLPASNGTVGDAMAYDGSTWSNKLGSYSSVSKAFFYAIETAGLGSNGATVDIVSFNSNIYAAAGAQLYKWNNGSGVWAAVGAARGATITDLQVFADVLYIGLGDSTNHDTMNTGETYSNAAVAGRLFYQWNGYLYRAVANDVYYTTASTWTGPIAVGPDDYNIQGMAALGGQDLTYNDLYLATDDALSVLAASDVVLGKTAWGSPATTNGRGMLHHQGDVFIPVGNGLLRHTNGGQILSTGLDQGEGLPGLRQGKVRALASLNNYLLAFVDPTDTEGMATLWAWNHEGWHHLATLPAGIGAGPLYYDRSNSRLWMGTGAGLPAYIYFSDRNDNPLRDSSSTYAPFAWVETGWFSGGLKEVQKDVESIYIASETRSFVNSVLSVGQTVAVYWQDDDSTAWESLATFTRSRQEEKWPDATRPNTRQVKLGFLLATDGNTLTPSVEAIRLKYVANVSDRWRWQLPVRIADQIEMVDGNYIDRDSDEQRSDLDDAIQSVAPVTFYDVDGTKYDVRVTAAQESISKYEMVGQYARFESIWYLSLLQVSA